MSTLRSPSVVTVLLAVAAVLALAPAACDQRPTNRTVTTTTPTPTRTAPTPTQTNNTPMPAPTQARPSTPTPTEDSTKLGKSPMDQSESGESIRITAEIRRAIIADSAMSVNAQNCKIITETTGVVTLRGMVSTVAERDKVEAMAKAVSGVVRVDNQLEVKAN